MPQRKTDAEFRKELFERYHGKLTPQQRYLTADAKLLIKCNICDYIWWATPKHLLNKYSHGCPKCYRQHRFLHKLHKVHGNDITPLQMYQGIHHKIWFRCNKCGYKWKTMPYCLLRGSGCPKCADSRISKKHYLSNAKFLRKLHKVHGNDITPLEEYRGCTTKIWFKCNKCGHKWKAQPRKILEGSGCHHCAYYHRKNPLRLSNAEFLQRVNKVSHGNITPLEKYKGSRVKIWCRCNTCGHKWKASPNSLLGGYGCPKCAKKQRSIDEQFSNTTFLKRVYKVSHGKITPLEKYKGSNIKIWVRCNVCGYQWLAAPESILHGFGCPHCSNKASRGEKYIYHWLHNHLSVHFVYGYVIPTNRLHLDFWIPALKLAIEFDGVQHFEYVPFFDHHQPNQFKDRIHRDHHKNYYCIHRHITLIRIQNSHNDTNYKRLHHTINHILTRIFSAYRHHRLPARIYHFDVNHHGHLLRNRKKSA